MVESYSFAEMARRERLHTTMLADRKKVFVDTLKWQLVHDGRHELDQFDDHFATYLVRQDNVGRHQGSMRLLPSTGPHILGDIYPFLCDADVPRGPGIMEITRFLMSPRFRAADRLNTRNALVRAMIEYAFENGIEAYTAVCDLGFLSQVLAAGWRVSPLGMPQQVGNTVAGAFMIHIDADTIEQLVPQWSHPERALNLGWEKVA